MGVSSVLQYGKTTLEAKSLAVANEYGYSYSRVLFTKPRLLSSLPLSKLCEGSIGDRHQVGETRIHVAGSILVWWISSNHKNTCLPLQVSRPMSSSQNSQHVYFDILFH